jgi:hypothetical protein
MPAFKDKGTFLKRAIFGQWFAKKQSFVTTVTLHLRNRLYC